MAMNWNKLLTDKRLFEIDDDDIPEARSNYQRDVDRITFSAAFRRLQDKTQVFPLSGSDYIRTRLTHSLEVSCVGRSLGTRIGDHISHKYNLHDIHPSYVGSIVAAACLAHDIGNPPFGHEGEFAISEWFKSSKNGKKIIRQIDKEKRNDFLRFEGNAQGFRQLVRIQNRGITKDNEGGLKLTCATLSSFVKYPRFSFGEKANYKQNNVCAKKYGIFYDDKSSFVQLADIVGLKKINEGRYQEWARHPLAFLVESADDICYQIIDLEDGSKLKCITHTDSCSLMEELINKTGLPKRDAFRTDREHIEYLRALVIRKLIRNVTDAFITHEESILDGSFDKELISLVDDYEAFQKIIKANKKYVYTNKGAIEVEAAGYEIIGGLLDSFMPAVHEVAKEGEEASPKSKKLIQLIPSHCLGSDGLHKDYYIRTLKVVDFVSGMTDSFALNLYRKVRGISLPNN